MPWKPPFSSSGRWRAEANGASLGKWPASGRIGRYFRVFRRILASDIRTCNRAPKDLGNIDYVFLSVVRADILRGNIKTLGGNRCNISQVPQDFPQCSIILVLQRCPGLLYFYHDENKGERCGPYVEPEHAGRAGRVRVRRCCLARRILIGRPAEKHRKRQPNSKPRSGPRSGVEHFRVEGAEIRTSQNFLVRRLILASISAIGIRDLTFQRPFRLTRVSKTIPSRGIWPIPGNARV